MPGLTSFFWGAAAAMIVAAASYAIAWRLSRRGALAWNVGVVAGFAAGAVVMAAHTQGFSVALARLVKPVEAHGRLPLVALAAFTPALLAAASGRRWTQWLLAAPLAALVPYWLLRGGRYLPSAEIREFGSEHAWSLTSATLIFVAIALATLAAWWMWDRAHSEPWPRVRTALAVAALGGAGLTVVATGSFTYAYALALMSIATAACAGVAWLSKTDASVEAAAGPILMVAASVLVLSVCYSELKPWQCASLAAIIAVSAGWLPLAPSRPRTAAILRAILVMVPLTAIAGVAVTRLAASQQPTEPTTEADVY